MQDHFARTIDYLRLSITDRCNLHCQYCMPFQSDQVCHAKQLGYEELLRFCTVAAEKGIRHIKITGGEPLVRPDCVGFMKKLKAIDGIESVTITTNGVLLKRYLPQLIAAKIDGINISIDTLNPHAYAQITGVDVLPQVLEGAIEAVEAGLLVKLNCVPQGGEDGKTWLALAALLERYPFYLRFIEMMPIGQGKSFTAVDNQEILQKLTHQYGDFTRDGASHGFGPAQYYKNPKLLGSIGFISAIHGGFCHQCNRLRLTSEGFLKACLHSDIGWDVGALLERQVSDEELARALERVVALKPKQHQFHTSDIGVEQRSMAQIGG